MKQMIRYSLALAAFGTVAAPIIAGPALAEPAPGASAWEIGPIIRGRNYSVNMPLRPAPTRDGFAFDFPGPERADGHVHYVTFDPGSLEGATKIRFTYRIDAAPGVRFVPQEAPTRPATISLFFQRRGDNWRAKGKYEHYRWFAPRDSLQDLRPGTHTMTVSLDDEWISVLARPRSERPETFRQALREAGRVGFVLGSRGGYGHGVFATGPARLTVTGFEIL